MTDKLVKLYTREEAAAAIEASCGKLMEAMASIALAVTVFNQEVAQVAKHSPHLTADERERLAAIRDQLAREAVKMAAAVL